MLVLGIETTCDETAAAVVRDGKDILSNFVASQASIHEKYGGVFPEVACREHIEQIIPTIRKGLYLARCTPREIDLIAVAKGPGLIGALLIGLNAAKALSLAWKKPFIGVSHIEAHLYASMMNTLDDLKFPALGLVISGGHTLLVHILDMGRYRLIGRTVDDALGEAFDKVATLLGLPYPGGPAIEVLAKEGNPERFTFRAGRVKNFPFHFSFSGLKTKVLYTLKGQGSKKSYPNIVKEKDKRDIAASFQKVAFMDIIDKTLKAAQFYNCQAIYVGGGVSNSNTLKEMFKAIPYPVFWPDKGLSLDNGAMIAGLGYQKFKYKKAGDSLNLKAQITEPISLNPPTI